MQLKSNLLSKNIAIISNLDGGDSIFSEFASSIGDTYKAYNCNWQDYIILIICVCHFDNILGTETILSSYFSSTITTRRPVFYLDTTKNLPKDT